METKSEKIYRILKSLKYPEIVSLSPKNFEYLFQIPDVHQFFDWFIVNDVNNYVLSQDEIEEFTSKTSSGHAIWDLKNLEDMNQLLNLPNIDESINDESEEKFEDDQEVLEEILKKETQLLEQEMEHMELNRSLKKKCADKLLQLKKVEANREILSLKLNEKENYLKGSLKLISQNLQKSAIEFQTKFGDEYRLTTSLLLSNSEAPFEQSDLIDEYILNERKLCKELTELFLVEPQATSHHISIPESEIPLWEHKIKISMHKYFEARIHNACIKSNLAELRTILENYDSITEKFIKAGDERRLVIEDETRSNEKKAQTLLNESNIVRIKINKQLIELLVLKQLNWDMAELNRKLVGTNLFRSKQERLAKLLNAQKSRVEIISYFVNSKIKYMVDLDETFEELMAHNLQMNQIFKSSLSTNSCLMAAQLSSTLIAPFNTTNIQPQSPLKENQFTHILNQFLISTLSKFESESSDANSNEFQLKNQISTLFNDNLDTYIDLAVRIRARHAIEKKSIIQNSSFHRFFKAISKTIQYFYEKENGPLSFSSSMRENYNLKNFNLTRPTKYLEEELKLLNEATTNLQSVFISKIYQVLNTYKTQLNQNELMRFRRDFLYTFIQIRRH